MFKWGYKIAVWLMSRSGPFGMTEKSSDRVGRAIGLRNRRRPRFYSVSLMVGIGLGREVGVLVYGVSRLVGGGGMVQVGSGGA